MDTKPAAPAPIKKAPLLKPVVSDQGDVHVATPAKPLDPSPAPLPANYPPAAPVSPPNDTVSAAQTPANANSTGTAPDASAGDPNALPGTGKTMVGPVASRAIRMSPYPAYPEWAQQQGIQTEVILEFYVDAQGNVVKVETTKTSGYPRLDYQAIAALKRWKFDALPAEYAAIPNQWGRILFKFRLQ